MSHSRVSQLLDFSVQTFDVCEFQKKKKKKYKGILCVHARMGSLGLVVLKCVRAGVMILDQFGLLAHN